MRRFIQFMAAALGMAMFVWAAEDPVVGTWKLNVAKSKYLPGPLPRGQTRVYEAAPDGIRAIVTTLTHDGQTIVERYPSNSDGMVHTVSGSLDKDGIVMTRMDYFTSESKIIHGENVIGVARRVVSGDGKTMTITYEGSLGGEKVKNVGYYERQ